MVLKNSKKNVWFSGAALLTSITCAAVAYFLLTRIDLIVHGELYNFGLNFSSEWADPYRTYMLLIYVCLILPIVLSSISLFFSFKVKVTPRAFQKPAEIKKETIQKISQTIQLQGHGSTTPLCVSAPAS